MKKQPLDKNGFKYSREAFEGHTHRAKLEIDMVGEDHHNSIDIYTNNPDRNVVEKEMISISSERVKDLRLVHWTTKEQDEMDTIIIDEFLKDI